jgi:hypothetical protein
MAHETTGAGVMKGARAPRLRHDDAAMARAYIGPMPAPPIPQRIPPLAWRKPALLWTPAGLALAIGGPFALLRNDAGLAEFALIAGAGVFALALVTLGTASALGRAPRTRREVVAHVVGAGAIAALLGPLVLTRVLAIVADYEQQGSGEAFDLAMAAAATPLALVIGLPVALASGIVFALVAMTRPRGPSAEEIRHTVQPFR